MPLNEFLAEYRFEKGKAPFDEEHPMRWLKQQDYSMSDTQCLQLRKNVEEHARTQYTPS